MFGLEFGTTEFLLAMIAIFLLSILCLLGGIFYFAREDNRMLKQRMCFEWQGKTFRQIKVRGYLIKIVHENGMWSAPFKNVNGEQLACESVTALRDEIKSCLRNPHYEVQIDQLAEAGDITKPKRQKEEEQ